MLDLIRKKQKTVIIKVVFWAIIATFVGTIFLVWGKGSERGEKDPTMAAVVNGTRIGYDDYQNAYSNLYRMYQNVYREKFTPALEKKLGLRQQALDALVEETLLVQEAGRQGLEVSRKELVKAIAEIPAFQDNGAFSRDRYLRVLASQRLNPDDFEKMEQRQLLIEKIRDKIQQGVTVSDDAIAKEYRDRNEKIALAFVRLSPALFESRVKVDEAALKSYFTEHQEAFRLPETASLRYLLFEPGQYAKDVTYEDGELQGYYRHHLDQFEIPEQVKAAHILIKLPPDASPELKEQKRKLAAEVLEKARAGQDFAQLAKKYSDDPGSAAKGGELGLFPRGTMVAPFEKAAFSLAPGQISDIVESPFGFHIIKVEQHIDAGVKPFAEVAETVKTGLQAEKAQKLAYEKAIDAYNVNRQGGSLDKAAEANGMKIRETGYFDRQGSIDGLGEAPEIAATVFSMQPGELARPVILPQGVVLFALKDRRESRRPELAEVRGKVEQAYRQEKAQEAGPADGGKDPGRPAAGKSARLSGPCPGAEGRGNRFVQPCLRLPDPPPGEFGGAGQGGLRADPGGAGARPGL